MKQDLELAQYRGLMETPTAFADGFSLRSVIGCVFIGLVMMPGAMYLSLLIGGNQISQAAQWVTVILFVELARRSFTTLQRPEIFVLFYMAGAAVSSPFQGLLWTQYYVTSEAAKASGVAEHIPWWVAPPENVIALRTFFHPGWLGPIGMIVLGQIFGRIDNFGLGYVLFRVTSDAEKLPFPMAPIGALGITALADSSAGDETWRWRVFSIGGMMGLLFGALFVGVPAITGTFLKTPITLIEPTFVDLTGSTERILPATPVTLSFDLGNILVGMVLPFYAVVGSFIGMLVTWLANPVLQATGQLPHWRPGMNAIDTSFATHIDVYLSIGIGLSLAIAIVGFWQVGRSMTASRRSLLALETGEKPQTSFWQRLMKPPPGRGDIPLWVGIAIYLFSTTTYIVICWWLVPGFPLWILIGYGFVYTPIISYVAARMEGVAGQWVDIPMVREATFIASQSLGYRGVEIWFAPIPLHNYASTALAFRTQELTGTKFTSIIKAEMVVAPVVIISSIVFSQYLWRLAPIPSAVYPFTNKMWELGARAQALTHSSTLGGPSMFYEAIKWRYLLGSTGLGLVVYTTMSSLGAPVMLCYGLVRGLGAGISAHVFPQMIGALLGRYIFEKRFGLKWRQYAPVLVAGFACGVGLVSMLALGCVLISKAVFQLPY